MVVVPASARIALLVLVFTVAVAVGGFISMRAAYLGVTNYRVIYLLLTRSIAWFMMLYLAAGLLVMLGRRKPEPVVEV